MKKVAILAVFLCILMPLLASCSENTPTIEPLSTTAAAQESNDVVQNLVSAVTDNGNVWIPTKGGTKYHTHEGCSSMIDPVSVSLEEAQQQGFTPCKHCYE